MRIKKAGVAVLAVAALALGACSGASDDKGSASGEGSAKELKLADYNEVDPADLVQGGNFNYPIAALPSNYNPMHVDGNNTDNNEIWGFTGAGNLVYAEDGTFEPNPNYIESIDVNDAPDNGAAMVITLKLNKDAKWYDGTPITVADYKATWDACNDPEDTKFLCASNDGWVNMTSVEQGADEFEVVVSFDVPYPDWSANFSTVYPASGVSDPEFFATGWVEPTPDVLNKFVSGPFKFSKIDTAANRITLVPNEKWWGSKPKLDTVTITAMSEEARAQAFANKEIDVVNMIVSASTYELVQKRDDAQIVMSGSPTWRHLTLNSKTPALSDIKVRQAIQYGVAQDDYVATDFAGLPSADYDLRLGNHFFMPGQDGYQDNSFEYDPEKAKSLLEEAGYTLNDSTKYYEKDGTELSFKFLRIPDNPVSESAASLLVDQMKEIGIKVEVVDEPSATYFDKVTPGEFEVTSFGWQGTPYPMANINQIYGVDSGSNFAFLNDERIDEYAEKIAKETDVKKRQELTNEVDKIIWDNVMVIPLYARANITAIPENLANFGAASLKSFLPENIGYTK